jgi:hypothetical protein
MIRFPSTMGSYSSESRIRAEKVIEPRVVEVSPEPTRAGWNRSRIRLGVKGARGINLASLGSVASASPFHTWVGEADE